VAAWPPEDTLDAAAMTAARWAYAHVEPAGSNTATLPIIPWYFVPLRIGEKTLGAVGLGKAADGATLDSEARTLLNTLAEQAAAALDRALLGREMVSAKAATETERVRNTLLASISHDFRTPLASILGSASSLVDYGDKLDAATRQDLLEQIRQETEGLDGMVRNLLAITRIDAGALEVRRDWIDLREIVQRVVSAALRRGARQQIEVALPPDLPLVRADATLSEQAVGNVVANAVAHTGAGTSVRIGAAVAADNVTLTIEDDGPGIAADALPAIFDKFVKGARADGDGAAGTGLGLAIAKGIMDAQGGATGAESPARDGRGARFTLVFRREEAP
jgi:two-component system sensor histidine kinase KdpD